MMPGMKRERMTMFYKFRVEMTYDKNLNYIRHLNDLDKIWKIRIFNDGEETVRGLQIKLSFVPDFAESWIGHIDEIKTGEYVDINEPNLVINPEKLLSYNEKLEGNIIVELMLADGRGEIVYKDSFPLTVLPYDQWLSNDHPELLAAFVTPNDRRVLEILAKAGERLGVQEGIAFSGYSGRQEVLRQMQVIYEVIQEEKISYCYPPANWDSGQRVRMPGFTLANKLGCCIDMAVLYAACLEAANLNPMVMILHGHAVAGCWLKDASFEKAVVDDRASVENRSYNKLGELAMVECTLMDNYAGNTSFTSAMNCTDKHFAKFEYVVDIKRARQGGIRPMPLKEIHDDMLEENGGNGGKLPGQEAETADSDAFYEDDDLDILPEGSHTMTKMDYWERKILDLTLHNALLSTSFRGKYLPIMGTMNQISGLAEGLQAGRCFRILEAPEELFLKKKQVTDPDEQNALSRQFESLTEGELHSGRIRVFLNKETYAAYVKNLYRQAHTFMEESGANALYLAVGFLKWRQKEDAADRYAPLMLIPVTLNRGRADTDYTLIIRDDEWQMNITLFEMLRQKYNIDLTHIGTVPTDNEGRTAYKALFKTIREAVKLKKGWDVEERAVIGIFSFGQYMLWRDLRDHGEQFAEQPLVSSLLNGHLMWRPERVFMSQEQLDRDIRPDELVTPVSADGSQLTAIEAASKGESFVMHGPPGTGKSQTITNMIANALYQGKTVLFLAKKMPALEVVQSRLQEIGLEPFCLELHAKKASKAHVLNQFAETLKLTEEEKVPLYERTSHQLMEKRRTLRALVERLHEPSKCGKSLYELMRMLENYQDAPDMVHFDDLTVMLTTKEDLADWERQLDILRYVVASLGRIPAHPLQQIHTKEFKRHEKQLLRQQIHQWFGFMKNLRADVARMQQKVGIADCDTVNFKEYISIADVLTHAVIYPKYMSELLNEGYSFEDIQNAFEQTKAIQEVLKSIDNMYDREILSEDLAYEKKKWQMAGNSDGRLARMQRSGVLRMFRRYARNPEQISAETLPEQMDKLMVLQKHCHKAGKISVLEKEMLKNGYKIDWPLWQKADKRMRQVLDRLDTLMIDEESYRLLQDYIDQQAMDPDETFRLERALYKSIVDQYLTLKQCTESIMNMAGYDNDGHENSISEVMLSDAWTEMLQNWLENYQELDAWCSYQKEREQAQNMGLSAVVSAIDHGLQAEEIFPAFYKGWAGTYVKRTIEKEPQLQYFSGLAYEQIIEKYRRLCEDFQEMSRQEIRARLLERLPNRMDGSDLKDFSILQKAIMGAGSKLTTRQLFSKMPGAVQMLAPCMLMSPASVAQFIDPDFPKFDLVIMDEASQLPTCEAVGAIARGKSVVIAGDEQQMPPTNFFKKKSAGEDIEMDDLESILDDALALNMPQCYLSWHYRSAHESLITFSNTHYYDSELRTFPSVDASSSAVQFINVGGIYDRAGTRTNEAEAKAVVDEIERRIMAGKSQSIGVMTLNIQQRGLINDCLQERMDQNPAFHEAVIGMNPSLFIKNLENIQGDERDVIILSLGYGPDEEGNMSMNFGPVNQEGGHRRLNVAVTRARQEMLVYASFDPSAMRTTERSARGLRDLKAFLEYAKQGAEILKCQESAAAKEKERINREIAEKLREKGWNAEINIGTGKFRIDVAVRHLKIPEKYCLGIMFDDDASALQDTVRDRNLLQKDVLQRMGWKILNLWLLDWYEDSTTQIQRIEDALKEIEG